MVLKILFWDTNAVLSYFLNYEKPHARVRWLCSLRTSHSLCFVINQQVVDEFIKKINERIKDKKISPQQGELFLKQFDSHFLNKFFHLVGQTCPSPNLKNHEFDDVMADLGAIVGRSDYDARIYQSILNSLAIYGGDSRPILVTSDQDFAKLVEARGYQTIRPSKHSESEILRRLTVPSELVK